MCGSCMYPMFPNQEQSFNSISCTFWISINLNDQELQVSAERRKPGADPETLGVRVTEYMKTAYNISSWKETFDCPSLVVDDLKEVELRSPKVSTSSDRLTPPPPPQKNNNK